LTALDRAASRGYAMCLRGAWMAVLQKYFSGVCVAVVVAAMA
jgi:hypothetical protein